MQGSKYSISFKHYCTFASACNLICKEPSITSASLRPSWVSPVKGNHHLMINGLSSQFLNEYCCRTPTLRNLSGLKKHGSTLQLSTTSGVLDLSVHFKATLSSSSHYCVAQYMQFSEAAKDVRGKASTLIIDRLEYILIPFILS